MSKQEILKQALESRDQEVIGYQINIDNYRLAIEYIEASKDKQLDDFLNQLKMLLASEQLEQKKAKVMQAVIAKQLEE